MTPPSDAARLRGSIQRSADARLVESAARSSCERLGVIASTGTDLQSVVDKAYPNVPKSSRSRISPFARSIGIAFENRLFSDNAEGLCDIYEATAGWRPNGVLDLRSLHQGEQELAVAETLKAVQHRIDTGGGPELILGTRFNLKMGTEKVHVHPDVLVAMPGWHKFRVGDVKSYLDLDGRTDPVEIATAVRQIAVGVTAIRQLFGESAADNNADLILKVPRRPGAGVRTLDASMEVATIGSWLHSTSHSMAEALKKTGGLALDSHEAVEAIPHHWDITCEDRCPMAPVCHKEAVELDELALLGPSVTNALEGIPTLSRATALATGDHPMNPDEERVAETLNAGWAASLALEAEFGI